MRHRFFVLWALAAVIAVALLAPASAAGQARTATDRWTAPRTPWGHPDLQGTWTNTTTTRLERPSELAAKAVLTERERATLDEQAAQRQDRRPPPGSTGAYNSFWMEGGKASRQASLVMDPPDGRLPFTPEARKRADAFTATISGSGTADSWEDRNLYERCITRGLPGAIDAETIDYQITVNDPDAFTRPWTAAMPMNRIQGPLFEYACHEGNYGLEDILKGARTQEKAATKTESR